MTLKLGSWVGEEGLPTVAVVVVVAEVLVTVVEAAAVGCHDRVKGSQNNILESR